MRVRAGPWAARGTILRGRRGSRDPGTLRPSVYGGLVHADGGGHLARGLTGRDQRQGFGLHREGDVTAAHVSTRRRSQSSAASPPTRRELSIG